MSIFLKISRLNVVKMAETKTFHHQRLKSAALCPAGVLLAVSYQAGSSTKPDAKKLGKRQQF